MAFTIGSLGNLKVDLNTSAHKIRKELVKLPLIGAQTTLKHMTLRPGLRMAETIGELAGDIQYGPYSSTYKDANNITINPRTLEVFFGSVIKDFDPNEVAQSIYGQAITKGKELQNADIVAQILPWLMAKLGANLNASIWDATRNASGHTTKDLFNGFDTITATEVAAGTIAAGNGNYEKFSAAITDTNAVDVLQAFVQSASDELQGHEIEVDPVKLFCSYDIFNKYNQAYAKVVGVQVYNKEYTKRFVEGTNVELVPLVNKKASNYVTLSSKANMLVGVNQVGEEETVAVDMFGPFTLTMSATMFFGTQFESIDKSRLKIGELA